MINIYCDKCRNIKDSQLNIRSEGKAIIIECLTCGAMQKIQEPSYKTENPKGESK